MRWRRNKVRLHCIGKQRVIRRQGNGCQLHGSQQPLNKAIDIAATSKALLLHVKSSKQPDMHAPEFEFLGTNLWPASIGIPPMLLALSMELVLKGWIVLDRRTTDIPKEHDLVRLFSRLSPERQDFLKSRYDEATGWRRHTLLFNNYGLEDVLESARHEFVEWRYSHEMESGGFNISEFEEAVELLISEFEKSFVVRKHPRLF